MKRMGDSWKKLNLLYLLKVGIGSAVSIWLAGSLGLLYSPSAGIITLLTIQNTKRETISVAVKRLAAFLAAVLTVYAVFSTMGYTSIAFGVFILLFVGLCYLLGLKDGIPMNAVLMTHFLIEKHMGLSLIGNEVALLLIGMGIGVLINMVMRKDKALIRREQTVLEEEMKQILSSLADTLRNKDACLLQRSDNKQAPEIVSADIYSNTDASIPSKEHTEAEEGNELYQELSMTFTRLNTMLEDLLRKAYEDAGNTLLTNTKYLISYLEMRKLQVEVLNQIKENITQIPVVLRQSLPIAEFMEHTAASFHERNNAVGLLEKLKALKLHYKNEKLPVTREEFEYRAILFQILKELEYFLLLKRNFVLELENKNMSSYWS